MGGDGGVVAVNRRYMRGAGTADHTGDYQRNTDNHEHNALEAMTNCALTKAPLFPTTNKKSTGPIVACKFGRLYHKEAAVEALLSRRQESSNNASTKTLLGDHILKLSDLYNVRFHQEQDKGTASAVCPITGKALKGIIPAILLVPGKPDTPNVLSESALQQLPKEELELEYGPIKQQIRLAPPPQLLKEIQEKELDKRLQKKLKKKKKRKNLEGEEKKSDEKRSKVDTTNPKTKNRVETTIQSNQVLSSLFTTTNKSKKTDKEQRDSLFARNF